MKKMNFVLLLCISIVYACGTGQKTKNEQSEQSETPEDPEEVVNENTRSEIKDCDDFLERYEKWVDDYLEVMEEYVKNPMDASLSQDYTKVMQEASDWVQQWANNYFPCMSQEKYQEKYDEISEKVEKKMEELGLE